jgi:hypothetical protein
MQPLLTSVCAQTSSFAFTIRDVMDESVRLTPNGFGPNATVSYDNETSVDFQVTSVAYIFTFDRNSQSITNFDASVTAVDTTLPHPPLQLNVMVSFAEAGTVPSAPKSGDAGYAFNEPVIAARLDALTNQLIVQNATAGSFPIPFGYQCGAVEYTPLLFGVDTIGGCTVGGGGAGAAAVNLSEYQYFAIHGRASPNNGRDWIQLSDTCPDLVNYPFQKFIFFYEQFGSVTNAQRRLKSVVHQCAAAPSANAEARVVAAAFLLVDDQQLVRYVPPNPRPQGIPKDTWYPFSSSAANRGVAAPSAFGMVACVVLAVFFAY